MPQKSSTRIWLVALMLCVSLAMLALGLTHALRPPSPLPAALRGGLRLQNVTLIEPGIGRRTHASVEIEGRSIRRLGKAVVDATDPLAGTFVIPGLTDMHIHLPVTDFPGDAEYTALLLLSQGVTTARILGGTSPEASDALRSRIEAGSLAGPSLFSCGPFLDGAEPVLPGATVVTNPTEARRTVADLAERGVDCIKAYDKLDLDTGLALVESARRHGLPIVGHTPQALALEDLHLQDVQHLRGVHPPFEGEAMTYPHFLEAWARMDDRRIERVIEISREYGMAYTPTLVAIRATLSARDWPRWRESTGMQRWLPHLRDGFWSGDVGFNPARFMSYSEFDTVDTALAQMKRTVLHLYRAGIPLHTGTDANAPNLVPGISLREELELLVQAGLSTEQALELSTRVSPGFLGVEGAGTLRPGSPANLVIYRQDPSRDLTALRSLVAVVADGRLYTARDLDERLARYRDHYRGTGHEQVIMPVLRTALRALTSWLRP